MSTLATSSIRRNRIAVRESNSALLFIVMTPMHRYGKKDTGIRNTAVPLHGSSGEDLARSFSTKKTLFSYFASVDEHRPNGSLVVSKKPLSVPLSPHDQQHQDTSGNFAQLYLDLGQKHFGHLICSDCGMTYNPTLDARLHQSFHRRFMRGLQFQVFFFAH